MRPLTDCHAHTDLSYCADAGLTLEIYRSVLDSPGCLVKRQALTNHGFQAYFPPDLAWSWEFLDAPGLFDQYAARGDAKLLAFKEELVACKDARFLFGVEVELMGDGRLMITDAMRKETDLILGSLHMLPRAYYKGAAHTKVYESFFAYVRDLAASGIDVLAHPFRWLRETQRIIPEDCVKETVAIAKAHRVAIELNTRDRDASALVLVRECAAAGVPLALATDAHSVVEIGCMEALVELIECAGFKLDKVVLFDGRRPA
jgi:histidinol phosphatase-like PHP family hydrolase